MFNKYIDSSGNYFFFRLKTIEATKNCQLQRETTNDVPYFSNQCETEKDKLDTKCIVLFQQEEPTNNSVATTTTCEDLRNNTLEEKKSKIVTQAAVFQLEATKNYFEKNTDSEGSTNTIKKEKKQNKVLLQTFVLQQEESTNNEVATTSDSKDYTNNIQEIKRQIFLQEKSSNNDVTTIASKDSTNTTQEDKRQSKIVSQTIVLQQKETINTDVTTTTGTEDSTNTTQEEKRQSKILSKTIVFQQEKATNNDVAIIKNSEEDSTNAIQEEMRQSTIISQATVFQPIEATRSIYANTTSSEDSTNNTQEEKNQNNITSQTVVFQQKEATKNIVETNIDSKESANNTLGENKQSKTIPQTNLLKKSKKVKPKTKVSIKSIKMKLNNKLKISHNTDLAPKSLCDTLQNEKLRQSSLGNLKETCDLQTEIKAVSNSKIESDTCNTSDAISLNIIESNTSLQQTTVGMSSVHLDSSVDKSIHVEVIRSTSNSAVKDKCENEITDTGKSKFNLETSSLFNDKVCSLKNNTTEIKNKSILHIMEVQNRLRQNLLKRKMQESLSSAKQPRNIHEESDKNKFYLETLRKNLSTTESTDKINLSEKNLIINHRDSSFLAETTNLESTENNVPRLSEPPGKRSNPQSFFNQTLLPSGLSISIVSEKSVTNALEKLQSPNLHLTPIEKSGKPNLCVKASEVCSINNNRATLSFNKSCVDTSEPKTYKKSNKLSKLLKTSPPSYIHVEKTKKGVNFEEKLVFDSLVYKISEEEHKTSRQLSEQSTHQDTITKKLKIDTTNVQYHKNCTAVDETSNVTKESVNVFHQANVASNTSSQHKTNTYSSLNCAESIVKGSTTVDTITGQVLTCEENNTSKVIPDGTKQNEDNIPAVSDNTVSSSCALRDHLTVNDRSQNVLGTRLHPSKPSSSSASEELSWQSLRNAEFNKLIESVFQLYKKVFQPYRGNQRVPLDIKCAAIKCLELMKRDPVVDDNDVLYIMLKTYFLKFKETTEINITKVAEVLHLSIADRARCKERVNSACKLTSSYLREQEKTRALSEYNKSINSRSKIFKNIFNYFLEDFKEETPILLMPLYFRITQALLRFDTENAAYVYLVRQQILCLLKNDDWGFSISSSFLKDEIFKFLNFPNEVFLSSFTFVKELLVSFFMLACDRAEAKEVLEFAKFEPCSPQLQRLLAKQQQTLEKNQGNKEKRTNITPHSTCISPQNASFRILSSPTNAVRIDQTLPGPRANVPQEKMNSELKHQILPINYMQSLPATKPINYQQMVTSNQGSIGQAPHSSQQFQMYPHHTSTQNQKPIIQELNEPKQGIQHASFQQTFQNANQYRGRLVHRSLQATNEKVLPYNYQQNHSLKNFQNKNLFYYIPNQQTSTTIPQQVNYPPTNIQCSVNRGQTFTAVGPEQLVQQTTFTPNLVERSSIQSLPGIFNNAVTPNISDLGHYQMTSAVSIFIIK